MELLQHQSVKIWAIGATDEFITIEDLNGDKINELVILKAIFADAFGRNG